MNALIFNSGYGSRIADLIQDSHKSLLNVRGETILSRQLRLLTSFNVDKVIITTGPNAEKLEDETRNKNYPFEIVFVHNPDYNITNYIYSMHLASNQINDDLLMLHGDLVFNATAIQRLISNGVDSVMIDHNASDYVKDFKALIDGDSITKISTKLDRFDVGLQPFYYLKHETVQTWMTLIKDYIESNNRKVYAEDALNQLLNKSVQLIGVQVNDDRTYCKEIDEKADYVNVQQEIDLFDNGQVIMITSLENAIREHVSENEKILLVTFDSISKHVLQKVSFHTKLKLLEFNETNFELEEVISRLPIINDYDPDTIVSVGGGSVMDFSKCLLDRSKVLAKHIAVPTTCGTGSESTKFAVYYLNGLKQSLNRNRLLPDVAVLDHELLKTLPRQVLVSSVLDALSQSIESFWSRRSNALSKEYSLEALKLLVPYLKSGLSDVDEPILKDLQLASNLAGRAINLTTTTASHALSYNLTKLFDIPHGIAVCMTLPFVWSLNSRKVDGFDKKMSDVFGVLTVKDSTEAIAYLEKTFAKLNVWERHQYTSAEFSFLISNVNLERLCNNPAEISLSEIEDIYRLSLNKFEQITC